MKFFGRKLLNREFINLKSWLQIKRDTFSIDRTGEKKADHERYHGKIYEPKCRMKNQRRKQQTKNVYGNKEKPANWTWFRWFGPGICVRRTRSESKISELLFGGLRASAHTQKLTHSWCHPKRHTKRIHMHAYMYVYGYVLHTRLEYAFCGLISFLFDQHPKKCSTRTYCLSLKGFMATCWMEISCATQTGTSVGVFDVLFVFIVFFKSPIINGLEYTSWNGTILAVSKRNTAWNSQLRLNQIFVISSFNQCDEIIMIMKRLYWSYNWCYIFGLSLVNAKSRKIEKSHR